MRVLQLSSHGQDVLQAQCALAALNLYTDTIDGDFGPHLQDAVREFQQSKGLGKSGVIDAATAGALGLEDPPAVTCKVPGVTCQDLGDIFKFTPAANMEANLPYVLNAMAEVNLDDRDMVLIALATLYAEASTFLPVSEKPNKLNTTPGGQPFDKYAHILDNNGQQDASNFRGRGFIQITGRCNYVAYSKELFKDTRLVDNPLMVHQQDTAARILAHYIADRAPKFRRFLAANDLSDARALVNGGDNGVDNFSEAFTAGLKLPCMQQLAVRSV